jgi:hypothetical protein
MADAKYQAWLLGLPPGTNLATIRLTATPAPSIAFSQVYRSAFLFKPHRDKNSRPRAILDIVGDVIVLLSTGQDVTRGQSHR